MLTTSNHFSPSKLRVGCKNTAAAKNEWMPEHMNSDAKSLTEKSNLRMRYWYEMSEKPSHMADDSMRMAHSFTKRGYLVATNVTYYITKLLLSATKQSLILSTTSNLLL